MPPFEPLHPVVLLVLLVLALCIPMRDRPAAPRNRRR
jgi:hypothetical protein